MIAPTPTDEHIQLILTANVNLLYDIDFWFVVSYVSSTEPFFGFRVLSQMLLLMRFLLSILSALLSSFQIPCAATGLE